MAISGPFRRFSTPVWQNAPANIVRRAMVCNVYFPFLKIITLLKGLCAYIVFLKNPRPMLLYFTY